MNTTQRLINNLTLEFHPVVVSLLSDEFTVQFPARLIDHLSELEILILLKTITLHVVALTKDHYLLLMPDPLFALIRQHPFVLSQKVSLCEYQASEDKLEKTITTLMLTLPALQYNYQSSTLKKLASRLNNAKSNSSLPTNILPKKKLALFAGVSPSAIRLDNKKLINNDGKGKA